MLCIPGHVRYDEQGYDGDGDVRHVQLPPVPLRPPLVQDADAAADPQVQHDQHRGRGHAGRCERVELEKKMWKLEF